jgi:hypothetical protein
MQSRQEQLRDASRVAQTLPFMSAPRWQAAHAPATIDAGGEEVEMVEAAIMLLFRRGPLLPLVVQGRRHKKRCRRHPC